MNQILRLLLVFTIASCSIKSSQSQQNNNAIETKTNVISNELEFDFYNDSILTHVDAEELCEFRFEFFVPQLNKNLAESGLELDVQTLEDYERSFEMAINGRKFRLYSNQELSNGKFWDSGPRNFFRIVNDILREKGIDRRFYLLYGGNDLHAIFLSTEQFDLMTKKNENNKNELPYIP